ncbi:hypothetical protein [Natronorubrum thiooxidans]|uniref:hypothetical protein n=1 Tax=Natronorubrum thiooxidans TaxID=308853 RepID=UPI00117E4A76|nr:hypothetical protein [Natronorubrum thiooxidans]
MTDTIASSIEPTGRRFDDGFADVSQTLHRHDGLARLLELNDSLDAAIEPCCGRNVFSDLFRRLTYA